MFRKLAKIMGNFPELSSFPRWLYCLKSWDVLLLLFLLFLDFIVGFFLQEGSVISCLVLQISSYYLRKKCFLFPKLLGYTIHPCCFYYLFLTILYFLLFLLVFIATQTIWQGVISDYRWYNYMTKFELRQIVVFSSNYLGYFRLREVRDYTGYEFEFHWILVFLFTDSSSLLNSCWTL